MIDDDEDIRHTTICHYANFFMAVDASDIATFVISPLFRDCDLIHSGGFPDGGHRA